MLKVIRENVINSIIEIREKSKILKEMEASKAIKIVGTMHNIATGEIDFFEL